MECLDFLRELNIWSVMLRLTMAMAFGGLIGLERGRKRRAAGFRTYMLVCLGAALTMLLSQYESGMLAGAWAETAKEVGIRTDVSRFGAQVINGFVPLSEMFGYSTDLRSKTQGRGNYSMEVAYYDEVPKNIADKIVAKNKGE